MQALSGCVTYKGLTAMQHADVFDAFRIFLSQVLPTQIIEMGTSQGGFSSFLRDALDELGLHDSSLTTFDIHPHASFGNRTRIHHVTESVFSRGHLALEKPELIVPLIQDKGVTVLCCDGGNKKQEFKLLSPFLKPGDFIMAHDYVSDKENFEMNYRDRIWNWMEINDMDVAEPIRMANLEQCHKDLFDPVVWLCCRKKTVN
jgi:cephalosporin hydroxylase